VQSAEAVLLAYWGVKTPLCSGKERLVGTLSLHRDESPSADGISYHVQGDRELISIY
jgi:hypothetical protein